MFSLTIYDPATGALTASLAFRRHPDDTVHAENIARQVPEGMAWIEGRSDPDAQRVDISASPPSIVDRTDLPDTSVQDKQAAINAERDRRINTSLLPFGGQTYQFGPDSRENIQGAASIAANAITFDGAQPDDLYWHGQTQPFVFVAFDNTEVQMDAPTVVRFGTAAAMWKSAHIFAARTLKNMDPIPENFTADEYWP